MTESRVLPRVPTPARVFEPALCADDLDAAALLCGTVMQVPEIMHMAGRHVFSRVGAAVLLILPGGDSAAPRDPAPSRPAARRARARAPVRCRHVGRDHRLGRATEGGRPPGRGRFPRAQRRPVDLFPRSCRKLAGIRRTAPLGLTHTDAPVKHRGAVRMPPAGVFPPRRNDVVRPRPDRRRQGAAPAAQSPSLSRMKASAT